MYSGGPDRWKTSSLYTKYIALDFLSIADSIPKEQISKMNILHDYSYTTLVYLQM